MTTPVNGGCRHPIRSCPGYPEKAMEPLPRVHVIGMGEVGRRLAAALRAAGTEVVEVTRGSFATHATADTAALRLVCVREDALLPVMTALRDLGPERLVLVQNGWVRPLLQRHDQVTRGLIWFTSKGDFFRVLRPSPFGGPHATALAAALDRGGVPSTPVDQRTFARLEADKMGFNCVVGLPLAVHDVTLGDYLERHRGEAEALFEESVTVCARAVGARPDPRWWPEFLIAVEPLGWVRTSQAKALDFRNGAVVRLAAELGLEAPVNARLLSTYADR